MATLSDLSWHYLGWAMALIQSGTACSELLIPAIQRGDADEAARYTAVFAALERVAASQAVPPDPNVEQLAAAMTITLTAIARLTQAPAGARDQAIRAMLTAFGAATAAAAQLQTALERG